MTNQIWNPQEYRKSADFVPKLGEPVIELLEPKAGERILDLGCGTGILTKKLADMGCSVIGTDASPEMVAAARELGVEAFLADAQTLKMDEKFDAIMSNAAVH